MRIHHVALRTRDLARLRGFYEGVLGLRVRQSTERSIWLESGDAIVMLERAEPDEPEVPRGAMELLAFTIGADERPVFLERFAKAGVTVDGETAFTLYVRDPDGRRVGVSHFVAE